jgi:hypothetical protein
VDVSVLVADRFPSFSICGLPYLLGGDVADWRDLAHRTRGELDAFGVERGSRTDAHRGGRRGGL